MDTKEQNFAGSVHQDATASAHQDVTDSAHQDVTGSAHQDATASAQHNQASTAQPAGTTTAAQHAHPSKASFSPAVLSEQQKRAAHVKRIILLCVVVLCGAAYACIPGVQQWIHASFGAMTTLNMADLIACLLYTSPSPRD